MGFTVRSIEELDKESWKHLFAGPGGYLEFYKTKLPEEVIETTFSRFLDPAFDMWAAVAVEDETGKIIGFTNYLKQYHTWNITPKIYLNDLFVDPESRLRKVGHSLIQFVYDHADRLETPEVYWCTQFENHRAQMLYTKIGRSMGMLLYERP